MFVEFFSTGFFELARQLSERWLRGVGRFSLNQTYLQAQGFEINIP